MNTIEKRQMIRFLKETNLYNIFCKRMHKFYIDNRLYYMSESSIFREKYITEKALIRAFLKEKEQVKYYDHVFLTINKE